MDAARCAPPTNPLIFRSTALLLFVSCALLAFAFAMLEVSDSLVLAQKQAYYPIAKAIYELSNVLGEGPYLAAALGVWSMIFLGLVAAAARAAASPKN